MRNVIVIAVIDLIQLLIYLLTLLLKESGRLDEQSFLYITLQLVFYPLLFFGMIYFLYAMIKNYSDKKIIILITLLSIHTIVIISRYIYHVFII